jgi:ABC-type branched-subunit amino acid transport system ATPase component
MNDRPILETEHLTKRFGGLPAVQDLSVKAIKAQITSIIGPNGAGKTTLFNLLTGFMRPDEGDNYMMGKKITGLAPYRITRMGMARTFQLIRVFPKISVLDNILLGCLGLKGDNILYAILKTKKAVSQFSQAKEFAMDILETVGLPDFADQLANDLSYGQQKLVEIGRVLASDPQVLLLDEPMAGLSMTMIDQMIELIFGLKEQGRSIIIVEHNMQVVMDISDRIIVLNFGVEIASGTPKQIQNNPEVVDAYLGI